MEEDEGERKVLCAAEEDAELIPDEDRTAQLSKQILAQFAFAQAQPKKKMRGVEKKEKSSASRGRGRGVANSGSVVAIARKGTTTSTASSSGAAAARRKKRKSTEDDEADDLVVAPQGIIKDELEEDEGLLWEEVEFEHPRSNESEGRNDNAADDHAEDQGDGNDDDDDDDDAFLVPAQPATKSSAKARQRKPKAVEPKQESRKSAGPAALSTDLQNLIMKGKQKRKRNESKKDKKEQTSRQQQAEKRQRKEKQQMAVEVHKTHLLCLLAHHYHTNTQLEDELLQSTLLSLVPSDLWILHPNVGHEPDLKKRLRELMKWFRATFEIDNAALAEERAAEEAEAAALEKKGSAEWKKEAQESRFGVLPDRLMRVIEQKKGTPTQIAQLFVSMCRTLSLTTRYVAVLDPITFKTVTPRKPPQRPVVSSKGKSKSSKSLFDEDEAEDEEQESRGGKRKRKQAPAPRKRQSPAKKEEVGEEGNEGGDEAEDDFLTLVPSLMPRFAYSPTDDSDVAKPRATATSSTSAGTSPSATAAGAGGGLTPSPSKKPRRTTPTTTPSPLTSPPRSTSTTPTTKRLQGGVPRDMPSLWAEIYYPRETRWIHVDIVRNAVDQPQYYEETYPSIQLAYVASLAEGSLSVRDVTRRYTSRWSEVTQRRMPEPDWWLQTLSVISRPTEAMLDQNAYDESEQKGRELTEQMPTTLAAFKTHPLYCLERFVHKYEALYPRGPVLGEFKGQPIYPRSCVRKLHTKDKWIQKARAVREDEVPIKRVRKIIKKKNKNKNKKGNEEEQEAEEQASQSLFNDDDDDDDDDEEEEEAAEEDPSVPPEERDPISSQQQQQKKKGKGKADDDDPDNYVDLYGKWQTEDYVPPMALDGVVPKNEFGNIYLFKPSMLPVGAAHVQYPNACTIARRINVDCAPAMVGWRWAGARSVPEIEGVVVCEEYASLIEELCQEELERKFQAELEKRRKAVAERWKRMAKKLIVKQHLRDKYEAQHHEQGQEQLLLDVTQESGEEEKAKELTITVDKAQLESRRRGVELNHTHTFGEERCVDPDEDLWEKTCGQCGFVLAFEKM